MPVIQVTVEFIGLSRILTQEKKIDLSVDPKTTYRDILGVIANIFPALLGQVINVDGQELLGTNMMSLNGAHMIEEDEIDKPASDGDRIILMSILAGG